MKVKILLFPLSIVIAIVVSIFWIQPEISSALSLRDQKASSSARLSETDRVISNINALDRSLTENSGNEQFVDAYLPRTSSDDLIFDEVNFLAGESGLLLVSTGLKQQSSELVQVAATQIRAATDQAEIASSVPGSLVNTGTSNGSEIVFVASSPKVRVRSTDVSVSALGKYDQIKAFIDRIYHTNHFQSFLSITVSQKLMTQTTTTPSPMASDVLSADIVIRFSVLPATAVSQGVFLNTFNTATFSLATVSDLRNRATSELPPLDVTPSERSNPFLR